MTLTLSVGGLDGSLPQIFSCFKNLGIPSAFSEALEGYPLYSQDGKGKEAVCRAVFALGSVRWFILE